MLSGLEALKLRHTVHLMVEYAGIYATTQPRHADLRPSLGLAESQMGVRRTNSHYAWPD